MARQRRRAPSVGSCLGISMLLAGSGMAVGCSPGTDSVSVRMSSDQRFEPAVVEIPVDGTVTWRNDGAGAHTVTAVTRERESSGRFDSGEVTGTGTFSHTFDEAGSYLYLCRIHGDREMVGLVEVSSG